MIGFSRLTKDKAGEIRGLRISPVFCDKKKQSLLDIYAVHILLTVYSLFCGSDFFISSWAYLLLMILVSSIGSTILPSLYTLILPDAISSMRTTSPLL